MTPFEEGYKAESLADNPYWKNYPDEDCSPEEQAAARAFVDGYVLSIKDRAATSPTTP